MRTDLAKEFDILGSESVVAAGGQIGRAKGAAVGDERNPADRLDALVPQLTDDFAGVLVEFPAAREKRQTGRDGMAGRGCITRHGDFAREQTGTAGKIESMDFQQASCGVVMRALVE